ncbi:MAG: M3 family oligoendopeptidase [bacterium]|jgi:oligoendopeptidase F|nr:M3 family oligoendopeptidase [bacterium]
MRIRLILLLFLILCLGETGQVSYAQTLPSILDQTQSTEFPRQFVPTDANLLDVGEVEALHQALLIREILSLADLEQFILDWSELQSCLSQVLTVASIRVSQDTQNEQYENQYLAIIEEIEPLATMLTAGLIQKLLSSPFLTELDPSKYAIALRDFQSDIQLYREENVPLQMQEQLLIQQFEKIMGSMTVQFDGSEKSIAQLTPYLERTDRALRQKAWEARATRRLQDREALDALFDQMVQLRTQMAQNAGYDNYRDYMYVANKRFDYTPEDSIRFHETIESLVVPLARKLTEQRRATMGLDTVRPWDTLVDPLGRPPLQAFDTAEEYTSGIRRIFARIHPDLGDHFGRMVQLGCLDLESRIGKSPGAFCAPLDEIRYPFIFANAVGSLQDISNLLHESGHAFHTLESRTLPLVYSRSNVPLEFAEVASMSMELVGFAYLDEFFSPSEVRRAQTSQLLEFIELLPWVSRIDLFQHWVYTHPNHTQEERDAYWLELFDRFDTGTDWSGHENEKETEWHRQVHIFEVPFYYIEYGIALLGALQIWKNYDANPEEAIQQYRAALTLGNTRTLPELFTAAGARFDFSEETIRPLVLLMEEQLMETSHSPRAKSLH